MLEAGAQIIRATCTQHFDCPGCYKSYEPFVCQHSRASAKRLFVNGVCNVTEETFEYALFEMVMKLQAKSASDEASKHTPIKVGLGHKNVVFSGTFVRICIQLNAIFQKCTLVVRPSGQPSAASA
jgi:hypothetical protein